MFCPQILAFYPHFAVDDHGFHCTTMGSRSQSPCDTRFPAKKQGVYMETTMNYLPGDPSIKPPDDHKFVDIILDLFDGTRTF